nr:protein fizzy-related 2-like [Tanacetum cinerariifolium]
MVKEGSRDKSILQRGPRAQEAFVGKLNGHKLEVCGLKWSYDNRELASGGNDNRLFVWNQHLTQLVLKYCEHTAAVKAIAWSPHVHGLLDYGREIIWHLLAKSGASGFQPNPSTDEFIPTIVKDKGISYIHPQKFPDLVLARMTYVPGDLDSAVADRIDEVLEFPLP